MNIMNVINELPEESSLIPVLKDDAYGLGADNILPCIPDNIKYFAVAHISEGINLRRLCADKEILVLGNPLVSMIKEANKYNLTLSVSRLGLIPHLKKGTKVHIEFNTGLNRSGIEENEIDKLLEELKNSDVLLTGTYTHRGCFEKFIKMTEILKNEGYRNLFRHFSDSETFENHPEYSLDGVRIGRRLYMDAPDVFHGKIKEGVTWKSYITDIRYRKAGELLGYGGKYRLMRDSKLAIISIGTGDGLIDALINEHAPILIGGKRCPILTSFMDQTIVDVTDAECKIGDCAIIFGYDDNGMFLASQELGSMIGKEGVDLYSYVGKRVERVCI